MTGWELILALLGSSALGGIIVRLLDRKKTESETELNQIRADQVRLEMAQQLLEESKQFYDIRVHILEQEVVSLRQDVRFLTETNAMLQKQLVELINKSDRTEGDK